MQKFLPSVIMESGKSETGGYRILRKIICLGFAILFLCLVSCRSAVPEPESDLTVICLDVGQGDATLLCTKNGETVLVDTGPESAEEDLYLRLRALGVEEISLLVLTHSDEDHIGGADMVLEQFDVKRVWINGVFEDPGESYQRFLSALRHTNAELETVCAGDTFVCEHLLMTVLWPTADAEVLPGNDDCIVMRVQSGSVGMLLMGDAEKATEKGLLETYPSGHLDVQILHAGHHGGDTSCTDEFLDAARPESVVISCGAANRFGHPDGRVLSRLRERECRVYRTDRMGEITISIDGEHYTIVEKER